MKEFSGISEKVLKRKINAIEDLIRKYTNNNFQNIRKRIEASSFNNKIQGISNFLSKGDTVQITKSINDGLYVISDIDKVNRTITLDRDIYDCDMNRLTKIEYPSSVVEGATNLMLWEVNNRNKVGIQSETISRHSVTYFAQDSNNQVMGYPISLLGFLKPYKKARF